jgi:hypothetical protein
MKPMTRKEFQKRIDQFTEDSQNRSIRLSKYIFFDKNGLFSFGAKK